MNQSKFFEFLNQTTQTNYSNIFGTVGIISNYSAIKYYLLQTRMDLIGSESTINNLCSGNLN